MKRYILFIGCFISYNLVLAQKYINRYGFELEKRNNVYCLKKEQKIKDLNVFDLDSVPIDMFVPFRGKSVFIQQQDYRNCETKRYVYKRGLTRDLALEVDMPKCRDRKFPYIIWIHGGGWHSGDFNGHKAMSQYMASNGIVGFRISYSLLSEGATFENTWQDIVDAIAYIQKNAEKFNLDVERFGFAGHSAGGHLATYAAMRVPKTKLLVSFNGIYDINHVKQGWIPDGMHSKYFGDSFETKAFASPISYVHEGAPYCLLTYSSGDYLVDKEQVVRMERKLKELNVPCEVLKIDYYSHTAFIGTDLVEPMLMKMLILAYRYL